MKKTKLLLSLAMMCLSVAVLCFGVLAAQSVTYSISGTISYEVNDVFVKINTRVFGVAAQQDKATVIANVKTLESKALNSIADSTYKLTQTMVEYDSTNAGSGHVSYTAVDNSDNTSGVRIVYGTYYTYYIVINIQNLSSSKTVDAIITDNTTAEINSIKTTNLYQNNIASTETKNIVIAYSIKDKKSSVDSAAISYSLKVSYEDTDYTSGANITSETVNSIQGYYITLGKSSTSVTIEDVKWRLVSLDGTSRYTYSADDKFNENDNARYLSDAVFLQETVIDSGVAFNTSNDNNYFTSSIRTNIKDGSYFNLTTSNDLSFVRARKIDSINYWLFNSGLGNTYDSSKTPLSNTEKLSDKFWLLSCEELGEFIGKNDGLRKWNEKGYWLRTPNSIENAMAAGQKMVCCVVYTGGDSASGPTWSSNIVRAAFQLA